MVISIEAGLLASLAEWPDQPRPFWIVMGVLAGFAITLVIINVIWGIYNNWKISKAMTSSAPSIGINISDWPLTLRTQAEKDKADKTGISGPLSNTPLASSAAQAEIIKQQWRK
jgi:hypothetical protein